MSDDIAAMREALIQWQAEDAAAGAEAWLRGEPDPEAARAEFAARVDAWAAEVEARLAEADAQPGGGLAPRPPEPPGLPEPG